MSTLYRQTIQDQSILITNNLNLNWNIVKSFIFIQK